MMSIFDDSIMKTYGVPLGIFFLALAIVLTAIAQYYFTDRVFFDRKNHEIRHESRCFSRVSEEFRLSFDEVAGIALSGKWAKGKHGSFWSFKMVVVSKTGIIEPVSLPFHQDKFKFYTEMARSISVFIGTKFVEPNVKLPRLVLEGVSPKLQITYRVGKMGQGW
ncbi:MAG TPA: hypothetical protein PLM07_17780 [Candidatus Rifleibacterium sp.]|nr:hypothetical protein [Candidatus Rifleibacterium sp.]HPT47733.1 hypothetical protein [Candidatus Rifleibacterium sp.]